MVEFGSGPAKMRGERPQSKRLEKISDNTDGILTNGCLYGIYKDDSAGQHTSDYTFLGQVIGASFQPMCTWSTQKGQIRL
jgi:hypothetical protein